MHGNVSRWVVSALSLAAIVIGIASASVAQTGVPAFSTEQPISGMIGSNFMIVVPLANVGTGIAGTVEVTSISFGTAVLNNPTLPLRIGSFSPSDLRVLILEFDGRTLGIGGAYLLTVRGTYTSGTQTLGFAVNRFFTVTVASGYEENELREWATQSAIDAKFASLPHLNIHADNQEMLSFFRSRPEFVDSGIDPSSAAVWAKFANGRLIAIVNNLIMPAQTTANTQPSTGVSSQSWASPTHSQQTQKPNEQVSPSASAVAADTELPKSSTYRVLNTLGLGWKAPDAVIDIRRWLDNQNYTKIDDDASVEGLKKVGGEGVFYIASHGKVLGSPPQYYLWTDTIKTPYGQKTYEQELPPKGNHLIYFEAIRGDDAMLGGLIYETHYAINAQFVTDYWHEFGVNSLVYIDACESNSLGAKDFVNACFQKHASVYFGWAGGTNEEADVDDAIAADTARLIFDRLLGADGYAPSNPPQRPFDYLSVVNSLAAHGLGAFQGVLDGQQVDSFLFETPNGQFGLLVPSIAYLAVNEARASLTIYGLFGSDPRPTGTGAVTVGGLPVEISSWSDPNTIVTLLPAPGRPSAGDVVVEVRQHTSNVARLTQWEGTFRYTAVGADASAIADSLYQGITFNVSFRADMRQYRQEIDGPLVEPSGAVEATSGSATFSSGGAYTYSIVSPPETFTHTYTLKGSGDLFLDNPFFLALPPPAPNYFYMIGQFQDSHELMNMQFNVNVDGFEPCSLYFDGSLDGFTRLCAPPLIVVFELDNNATIKVGQPKFDLATSPCFPSAFQGVLTWNVIPATKDTAPDPKSAR